MKLALIKSILWCLDRLTNHGTSPTISKEAEHKMFASLYENPTFPKYLKARENYLIVQCANAVLEGKPRSAEAFGGQLIEIQSLHARVRAVFTAMNPKGKVIHRKD